LIVSAAPFITVHPTSVEPVKPFRHVGMLHQTAADEHVDDPLWDPRLEHELGQPQRRQPRQLGRLQDDGV